jgi:PAS domain S-box-containing protein
VEPSIRKDTRGTGAVFVAFSLVSLIRIFVDLTIPPENDLFKSGLYDTLGILTFQMLYIGLTFALFLMVNRRLLTTLENDITERKLAEEALKISEEKFSITFQNIPDAIVISSLSNGKIIDANESFFRLTGFTKEESLGRTTLELNLWGNIAERAKLVEALQKQHQVLDFETDFRIKSGEIIRGLTSGEIIQLKDQTCVLSIIRDITKRKQAEEALRASEERFRAIFEQAAVGVALLETKSGRYVRINQTYCDFLGYTPAELLQKGFQDVTYPEDVQANADHNAKLIVGQIRTFSLEKRYVRRDGTILWGKLTVSPLWNPGETPDTYFHIAVVENIAECKQAEEQLKNYSVHLEEMIESRTRELREAQEKLVRHETLAMLGQLAGSVGHELRNPLGIINSAVYFLKLTQPNADEKTRQYLVMIEREIRNADKIIGDLLDFARVKSVERVVVSVSELIRQTLERFPAPASVEVSLDLPTDLPQVFVDPHQMTQVLGNLTVNACQAMKDGGQLIVSSEQLSVNGNTSTSLSSSQWVRIAVKDTGVGIPPENMGKLFEPLFTTKPKGIGLGLAVSKKLAEANGGRLEVESKAGKGSTFTLVLPVRGD